MFANADEVDQFGNEKNIRLIIDISGSMKKNDPQNLRIPAVNLLVKLLPPDVSAGVWTFGQYVNELIKFDAVDESWKTSALKNSANINSTGLFTNIGSALEKTLLSKGEGGVAILLTDGVVDISKNPEVNEKERFRILNEVIPRLKEVGAVVHTVALSNNADSELLQEIATKTGGLSEVALNPEALTRIFLTMFDDAVKEDQLPLEGGEFVVDSSIEEFTLLVFVAPGSTPVQLRSPKGEFYIAHKHPDDVTWYSDSGYELITVDRPMEGSWKLFSDNDPQNRVTILSDLKLEVSNLQNNILANEIPDIEAYFFQEDKLILDEDFLNLMDVQLVVQKPSGKLIAKRIENHEKGVFSTSLDVFDEPGRYRVKVSVDGRTFKREMVQEAVFSPNITFVYSSEDKSILFNAAINFDNAKELKVIASLIDDTGKKRFLPLTLGKNQQWRVSLDKLPAATYSSELSIQGSAASGQLINLKSEMKRIDTNIEKVVPLLEDADLVIEEQPWWKANLAYLLIGAGNVIIFGVGLWVFLRRRKLKNLDDAELLEDDLEDEDVKATAEENIDNKPTKDESVSLSTDDQPKISEVPKKSGEGLTDIVDAWGDDLGEEEPSADKEPSADEEPSVDEEPSTVIEAEEGTDPKADEVNLDENDELAKTVVLNNPEEPES